MATSIKIPIKLYYPGEYSFAEAGGDDPKEKESKKEREKKCYNTYHFHGYNN